jgi:hypothetical protein
MAPVCMKSGNTLWIGSFYGSTLLSPIAYEFKSNQVVQGTPAQLLSVVCGPYFEPLGKSYLQPPYQTIPTVSTHSFGGNRDSPITITSTVTVTSTATVTKSPTSTVTLTKEC